MNHPIRTPPIPQRIVSQMGVLSRLPGATNLPSKPMMIPATITPMTSTMSPFRSQPPLRPAVYYLHCARQDARTPPMNSQTAEANHDGSYWPKPFEKRLFDARSNLCAPHDNLNKTCQPASDNRHDQAGRGHPTSRGGSEGGVWRLAKAPGRRHSSHAAIKIVSMTAASWVMLPASAPSSKESTRPPLLLLASKI